MKPGYGAYVAGIVIGTLGTTVAGVPLYVVLGAALGCGLLFGFIGWAARS